MLFKQHLCYNLLMEITKLKKYFPIMKKRLFSGFDDRDLEAVLQQAGYEVREAEKGAYIFREHDVVRKMGVVLAGGLVAVKGYRDGRESILDVLGPSSIFGLDIAVTFRGSSPFSMVAPKRALVVAIPFERDAFMKLLPQRLRKTMDANMIRYISDENIRKQRKIEIISQNGLRDRVCAYLEIMREKHGDRFKIPYTREQLADYLCVNRSALSHELGRMKQDGMIDFRLNAFSMLEGWDKL